MAMGFLKSGTADRTHDIMNRLLEELKRETDTRDMFDSLQQRAAVRFSPGGLLMLVVPMVDAAQLQASRSQVALNPDPGMDVDVEKVVRSLDVIIRGSRDDPSPTDKFLTTEDGQYPARTSLSVLRATHKNWCKIPPFCGGP